MRQPKPVALEEPFPSSKKGRRNCAVGAAVVRRCRFRAAPPMRMLSRQHDTNMDLIEPCSCRGAVKKVAYWCRLCFAEVGKSNLAVPICG
jgi:hypothetical protein